MSAELYVGLMSGTSLDGIDAALVSIDEGTVLCRETCYLPYPEELRSEALALHAPGSNELQRAALLGNQLADLYAIAVSRVIEQSGLAAGNIRAIGCHGQTVRHAPSAGYTIQLVNPARLAERTGITVVADFRNRDISAGGHGAPLVPAFHAAQFGVVNKHRIILNIGGIANITDLAPGRQIRGFDTGPGNMLLDAWAMQHLGKPFDDNGDWARTGRLLPSLLVALLKHDYLTRKPPKSCGREEFGLNSLESCLSGNETPADVQATLIAFTATTIAEAIHTHCGEPDEIYVCGGGARNTALMEALAAALSGVMIATTDMLGLPADWVEAVAFAWLAHRTIHGLPGNLPAVTGASGPRILGAVYPA